MPIDVIDKTGRLGFAMIHPKCENKHPDEGDFCDSCGDCLACCSEDPCFGNKGGNHLWVIEDAASPTS